jgi:perosamine synthetase
MEHMRLAINGGPCAVTPELRQFRHPEITEELRSAVLAQLDEQISIYDNGGIYGELERGLAALVGARHVLSVNSGTTALLSMYYGHEIGPGDEVVVPAYTFFATATPLFRLGAVPVLADCDESGNLSAASVSRQLTPKTRAVVVTHMWGIPGDLDALGAVTRRAGIPLLEDASHAHGAEYDERPVGVFDGGGAWSLQGKKILTAGEGGFLATNDRAAFERAVLLGHFNRRARIEVHDPARAAFSNTGLGLNLRMHPLGAALARAQLPALPRQLEERREVARYLTEELRNLPGLTPVPVTPKSSPAWYAFPVFFDPEALEGLTKERFVEAVRAEGAEEVDIPNSTRPLGDFALFQRPQDIYPEYRGFRPVPRDEVPAAYRFHRRVFKLPTWYGPRRMDFARAYVAAIHKVYDQRRSLLDVGIS